MSRGERKETIGRGHLEELYGIEVSPGPISTVTDAVLEEVGEWQNCPLDGCCALVSFDAIRVKIRDEGFVRNKAIYIALGTEGRVLLSRSNDPIRSEDALGAQSGPTTMILRC